ncbi:hypothetical protein QFC22_004504 [Naganishia vaughanmartiniae]|uniref:Uncharacterized protein n=1 Tax=Naganishia vaughanmartiniae TaxID=1424756 RepID=A0ACC2X0Q6_9TREE|nr:hypothetical protein QFC22_004504 [Naganishia vaughanmartiniae]
MAIIRDTDLHLVPGELVGEFHLGDSLWHVLEMMRTDKVRYGGTSVRWDREDPTSPVIVDVPPGIRLVFPRTSSPHQQLLQLIAIQLDGTQAASSPVYPHSSNNASPAPKSAYPGALRLMYDDKHLTTINSPSTRRQPEKEQLTRSKITQVFGTTFSRRSPVPGSSSSAAAGKGGPSSNRSSPLLARETEIRYPGVVFQLYSTVHGVEAGNAIVVVPPGREESVNPGRVWEVLDGTVKERAGAGKWDAFAAVSEKEVGLHGTIASCEIRPRHGILLRLHDVQLNTAAPRCTTTYEVEIGKTTGQDLLCDLGPPGRRYWKEDDRFASRYPTNGTGTSAGRPDAQGGEERETSKGCWWNYFHLGLDFLVEELGEGRVMKIMVHSNIPGTAQFHTHARCPWIIRKPSSSSSPPITSSSKDVGYLSLESTLDELSAAFDVPASRREWSNGDTSTATARGVRGGRAMSTVLLDRLDEEFMSGVQDIEPSRLLALDGMVLEEAAGIGITSVLLH